MSSWTHKPEKRAANKTERQDAKKQLARETLVLGDKVLVQGVIGTYRGPNPKIEGDLWIEFPDTGWWSYDPSDVTPIHAICGDAP